MLLNWKPDIPAVTDKLGADKYNLRTLLESSDETEEEALWNFVAKKYNFLYEDCKDEVHLPLEKSFIPLTPIEMFQKPSPTLRRRMFFKCLNRGDLLYLRVENESFDSYKLLAFAKHQGCWKIDDLSIVMYLPKYEPEMKLLKSSIVVGNFVRAALCSCDLRERRLYVTLDNTIVKTEFKTLSLGEISAAELPHYIGKPFLGISYTDYMFMNTKFWGLNWSHQFSSLGLDKKTLYSHFNNVERKKYSQFECLPHLKMKQSVLLSQSHYLQAVHCFDHGMPNIALIHLNNALNACAENTEALLLRGKVHSSFGNLRQAFIDTEDAVRLDPTYIPARKQMSKFLVDAAKTHIEQGNEIKAKESLRMARGLDSSNKEALLPVEELRDQMNNSMNSQDITQIEYTEPIPLSTMYLQYKKKKSKKHHRKRSRHHHHKKSKPKLLPHPIFLPGRKSPIPPPPAYPWDSTHIRADRQPPFISSLPHEKLSFPPLQEETLPSLYTYPQTMQSPLQKKSPSLLSSLSPVQKKPPPVTPTLYSKKSHIHFPQKPIPVLCTRNSAPAVPQIKSLPYFHEQSAFQYAPRHLSDFSQCKSPPRGLHKSKSPNWNLHGRSPTLDFRRSRSPSPDLHRNMSPSSDFLKNRSPSPNLRKSRSPSPGLLRSGSPSFDLQRSKSSSPDLFIVSRSPSPNLCRSRSSSPKPHKNESFPQSLKRSRSPPRGLHRSKSPQVYHRNVARLHRSRLPHRNRRKSRSSYCRSKSPQNYQKSGSPHRKDMCSTQTLKKMSNGLPRRSPIHSHSKRVPMFDVSEKSMHDLPPQSSPTHLQKRRALIKSILENRSQKVESTCSEKPPIPGLSEVLENIPRRVVSTLCFGSSHSESERPTHPSPSDLLKKKSRLASTVSFGNQSSPGRRNQNLSDDCFSERTNDLDKWFTQTNLQKQPSPSNVPERSIQRTIQNLSENPTSTVSIVRRLHNFDVVSQRKK